WRHCAACYEKFERVVAALLTSVDLRNNLELLSDEPGFTELGHELLATEAEPYVALLFAQPLVAMRHQIDHHQRSARSQDAHHLFQGGRRVLRVMKDQGRERGVDARILDRELMQIGFDELDVV